MRGLRRCSAGQIESLLVLYHSIVSASQDVTIGTRWVSPKKRPFVDHCPWVALFAAVRSTGWPMVPTKPKIAQNLGNRNAGLGAQPLADFRFPPLLSPLKGPSILMSQLAGFRGLVAANHIKNRARTAIFAKKWCNFDRKWPSIAQ